MTDMWATGGRISGIKIEAENGDTHEITTPNVVFATGPLFEETMAMMRQRGLSSWEVPIINELHARAVFDDPTGVFNDQMPLTFDSDPIGKLEVRKRLGVTACVLMRVLTLGIFLQFTDEEREQLAADPTMSRMLENFPSGKHYVLEQRRLSVVLWLILCWFITSGVHVRPYLGSKMMSVWTYDIEPVPARYPVEDYLDQRSEVAKRLFH